MIDKKIQLTFNSTVNKRVKVRSNCELYSHDKNNNEFELTINNYTLTNEEITVLFKFVKSIKYWETQGKIEDNKIKFKFDTSLITDNERVNCYIILKNEEKESDVYSFSFDVKMSEYDLKDNLLVKERYFANSVVVDKLNVLTKEVLATELEKAKNTYALKTDLSEFVRTSDISDVVRTATLNDYQLKSEMPNVAEIVNNTVDSKGFLTTHQSLIDYAKKSELPIDYVSNSKLEELKTQLTIDTSDFATKKDLQEVSNRQPMVDFSNLVTKTKWEEKYSKQDEVLNTISSKVYEIESNPILHFNVNNLVTKSELDSKGYLTQHQPLTDITNRLTALENRPSGSGNVDTSDFVTKDDLNKQDFLNNTLDIIRLRDAFSTSLMVKLDKSQTAFKFTENRTAYEFSMIERVGKVDTDFYGKVYYNTNERKIYKGFNEFVDLDAALYTLAKAFPDYYVPDYEFGESDSVKLITNKNIGDYINKDALRYIVKEIMKEK